MQLNRHNIEPQDAKIEISSWKLIQASESLREKRGDIPNGRLRIATVVRIGPMAAGEGQRVLEEWYRKQVRASVSRSLEVGVQIDTNIPNLRFE